MNNWFKISLGLMVFGTAGCLVAVAALPAGEASEGYARMLLSEKGLAAYWRMEGNLTDAKGDASGVLRGGRARFVKGPGGGKALALGKGQFVTIGKTSHLDLPETTVELLFKLTAKPSQGYNPCLIAKRRTSENTRFSVHVQRNLEWLDVWNGSRVISAPVPAEALRVGQWYHLAVAADAKGLSIYLDGLRCDLQSGGSFNFSAMNLPLQLGASSPEGGEQCECDIDEVAVYSRVLSEKEIDRHLEALGWADKKKEFLRQRLAREEQMKRRREERLAKRTNDPRLLARGETRVYRDQHLTAISLPLGGIGAGCIQINGKAERAIWQIFNNFKGVFVPHSFFAVRAKAADGEPVVRALQTSPVGPFEAMKSLTFRGEYPFGWYDFEEPEMPVAVSMETFSPLIPFNARDSAIPCAIFNLTARNTSEKKVHVSFLATQQNAVGFAGEGKIEGRRFAGYGGNRNRVVKAAGETILHMTIERKKDSAGYGDMALAAFDDEATATASWDTLDALLKDISRDGQLSGREIAGLSPTGQTLDGALAAPFTLEPGRSRTVTLVLSWYFPNGRHGAGRWGGKGNMYANWWDGAVSVASDVHNRFDELTRLTRLYHDTFYASNLPHWLLDRMTSQVAVLRSKTCFWTEGGYFGGWEGCCPGSGCCNGNCAHVWHYAQAHARLFPFIARRMREEALEHQQEDGGIPFRQPAGAVATDGQCGEILEAYREHLCSTNGVWLKENWPKVKKAMEYTIARWDKDEDGVLSGPQHNTLDANLGGSTTWLGSMYLAALAASEKMALLEGEPKVAQRYRQIRNSGSKKQNETLWNGEYYIQIPDAQSRATRDFLTGCDVDMMLGQWWANQLDLGWLYPPERVKSSLQSLFKYNFRVDFHGFKQSPRKFVDEEDAGLLDMTWPHGGRPAPQQCILYANEVQSGYEAAALVAMVQAGLLKEGVTVALAAADRYDGRLRTGLTASRTASWGYSGNPFGDDECGKFYARAMSIWSMLLACQGFIYDGPAGEIGFKPLWRQDNHATFFTAAEGWGLFTQTRNRDRQTDRIDVKWGKLRVRTLIFELPEFVNLRKTAVIVAGKEADAQAKQDGRCLTITLAREAVVDCDEALETTMTF